MRRNAPWTRRLARAACGVLLLVAVAACDLARSEEPACSAAGDLDAAHAEILACAGWLAYVAEHVCRVEYVNVIPAEASTSKIYGRAFCDERRIVVATQEIAPIFRAASPLEMAVTIVHEATHLHDDCQHGEAPALAAEAAFQADLCSRIKAGAAGCENLLKLCPPASAPTP